MLTRNKIVLGLFIIYYLTISLVYAQDKEEKTQEVESIILSDRFKLNGSEIEELENKAVLGSAEAAIRLYEYYSHYVWDFKKTLYWVRIAAENGNVDSQYNYGYYLLRNSCEDSIFVDPELNKLEKRRAKFWINKAADSGDEVAKRLLEEINE